MEHFSSFLTGFWSLVPRTPVIHLFPLPTLNPQMEVYQGSKLMILYPAWRECIPIKVWNISRNFTQLDKFIFDTYQALHDFIMQNLT